MKFSTLLLFLAIVATVNLELRQMDMKTAFLNSDLSEEIFLDQPECFVDCVYLNHVCKLLNIIQIKKRTHDNGLRKFSPWS